MIQQLVKLAKLKTDDGCFNYEDEKTKKLVGTVYWMDCNSFRMIEHIEKATGTHHKTLMVTVEGGTQLPAELFEYLTEWQVKQ